MWPRQQGWDDETDALAGPRRRKTKHMFGTIMPEIAATKAAEHHAVRPKKSGAPTLPRVGPSRRAIGRDVLGLFRARDRQDDGDGHGCDPAARGNAATLKEDGRRVSVEFEPPDEE